MHRRRRIRGFLATQSIEDSGQQGTKLQAREDVANALCVHTGDSELVGADRQFDVAQQPIQRPVALDVIEVLPQVVAHHSRDTVGVLEQLVEGAELGEPLHRGLLPHLRDAGKVVAGLADQSRDVRVLLRGDAVTLAHGFGVVPLELGHSLHARVEQCDALINELDRVAVA